MLTRKTTALTFVLLLAACSTESTAPDKGATIDTGPAGEASPGLVDKVILLGATPDKDFATNGRVAFTVFATAADGSAIIDKNLTVSAAATTPTGLTATVADKEEKRPPTGPLITALLFDSSGSMATNDPLRLRVEAGKQFIDQLDADDQVAVADFGAGKTGLFQATRLLSDFTTDKAKAKLAMALVKANGDTPMFESVSEVLLAFSLKFPAASYPNRALVVLGDGEPNGTGTLLGSCAVAATTKIPVNTVGFGPAALQLVGGDLAAIWNLGALAGCSHGAYSSAPKAAELSKTYTAIGQLLKKGAMVVTVAYGPVPSKQFVTGTLAVGMGQQTPVEVKYTFYAP